MKETTPVFVSQVPGSIISSCSADLEMATKTLMGRPTAGISIFHETKSYHKSLW